MAAAGGPDWIADVRPELPSLRDYDSWRNTFIRLGEIAAEQGRILHAALHFRSAEFFMLASDPRKEPLRKRLIALFVEAAVFHQMRTHEVTSITYGCQHGPSPRRKPRGRWSCSEASTATSAPAWH